MKKRLIALCMVMTLSMTALMACGKKDTSTATDEEFVTEATTTEEEFVTEATTTEESTEFVTSDDPADQDPVISPEGYVTFVVYAMDFSENERDLVDQKRLDEYSKNGLKYELIDQHHVLCTVLDQEEAMKATRQEMDDRIEEFLEWEKTAKTIKSIKAIHYSDDLTSIQMVCDKNQWNEDMEKYEYINFIDISKKDQDIQGIPRKDRNIEVEYVDEDGNILLSFDQIKKGVYYWRY